MNERLRILYVLHSLNGGGSEILTNRVVRALPSDQFDCAIIGLRPGGATFEGIQSKGVRLYTFGHVAGLKPDYVLKLRALIRQERPDVVNTHHVAPLLYTWMALRLLRRRPFHLHTVHVLPEIHGRHGSLSRKAVRLYHFLLKRVDHVVCVSQGERERLMQVPGLPASALTAIPNGIDLEKFLPLPASPELRHELGIPPDVHIITNIGVVRAQKNQQGLVKAFHHLLAHRQDVVLLLVGGPAADGADLRATEGLVRSLGLGEKVLFLGHRGDVLRILALTDVYVQPSLYEGLPLSVLEAMAMQRAIVATDVGGSNELIRDGVTGLLVPPGDPQAICEAVLRLLADPALRTTLGAKARELVSKDYSESCMIRRYETLYRALAHK